MDEKLKNADYDADKEDKDDVKNGVGEGQLTFMLVLCTATVSIGSSGEFGYNQGVITAPSVFIQAFINETYFERSGGKQLNDEALTWLWATVVSIYCIGGALGALAGGYWADYFGRNRGLIYNNFISIVGSLLMGCCQIAGSPEMIIIGRFVIGFSVGMSLTIVPLYLSEIAPFNLRGAITTTHQLLITIGLLLAQVLGFFAFYDESTWPIVLGLSAVTGLIEFIVLPFCPESPRWLLIKQNQEEKAIAALRLLRGVDDVVAEVDEMKLEHQHEDETEKVGVLDLLCLRDRTWLMPLLICVVLHGGQQLSGINAIIFYSTELYQSAGMTDSQIAYATVGFGTLNVIVTIISVLVVERLGRRPLLLYPFGMLSVCLVGLTVSLALQEENDWTKWMGLGFIYLYIIFFAIGPAPLPYVVSTEVWSQGPRPAAVSISIQVNWWANFLVQLSFPSIQGAIDEYTFIIFIVFVVLTTLFIYIYLPETKNRSFDEIVTGFRIKGKNKENVEHEIEDRYKAQSLANDDEKNGNDVEMRYSYVNRGQQTDE
ncbi:solute carrier family 2, facilitated glucose transporter member 1 [Strongylocentrotus purpuratus]|uniref:Major facilitator superfamily (MFS) profile domain-containing protein n=1 Tax=Strongylocentrotus purpuratus TaxID=7668 RepID=A0A7M7NJL2_STRPU|nr:solute carrier family 2, facilitated glucose transporter member 1 [Strongylocentrotus purpuratus]